MRQFIYFYEFICNLFKYTFHKFKCKKLQVWVGQKCSLRCKNCSQLFPYIEQKIYNIDKVIKDLNKLLKFVEPEEIHIIGGEAFTNPDIGPLIEYISQTNPYKQNKIVSNGTILPKDNILKILQKNKEHIFITVSSYDCVKERQAKFKSLMDDWQIPCRIIQEESENWYYMGDNTLSEITGYKKLMKNFIACWDKSCYTLADGELSICPRMHNSPLARNRHRKKERKLFIEHLPIRNLPNSFITTALIATCLSSKTFREACRFCYGVSDINNLYCKKAEQLKGNN